jgi:hypothetical protein
MFPNGINAVALLFMAALVVQSLPGLLSLLGRVAHPVAADNAKVDDDRERLFVIALSVAVGIAAVVWAGIGILSAVGVQADRWIDAVCTALVLASGSDKLSQFKSLIGPPTDSRAAADTVEVSGTVTVSKSDAF